MNCFINIPTTLALELIEHDFEMVKRVCNISKDLFIEILNSFHDNVKYTVEVQNNGQINFVYTTMIKSGSTQMIPQRGGLKQNAQLLFGTSSSHHQQLGQSLCRTCVDVLTSKKFYKEITVKVRTILLKNNFPTKEFGKIFGQKSNMNVTMNRTCRIIAHISPCIV